MSSTTMETKTDAIPAFAASALRSERALAFPAFEAPGPGAWEQDAAHWPRPVTPWTAATYPEGFVRGFQAGTSRFGVLVSHLEMAVVNGFVYYQPQPAVDPAAADAGARMGSVLAAAAEALATQRWREDLAAWDASFKPDSIRRNRELDAVDVAALSDRELALHVERCRENAVEMAFRHHLFTIPAVLPVGHFLARAQAWTGLAKAELLGLLRGSSPVSRGIACEELQAVRAALAGAGLTRPALGAAGAACALEKLRERDDAVGACVRRYLDACGSLIASGYDVTDRTARELPEVVLEAFFAVGGDGAHDERELAAAEAKVRAAVPAEHREAFDTLLAEARAMYRLRDERGLYNDLWSTGIARRALLEAGRKLALRGRLDEQDLVFEATPSEVVALLEGPHAPSSRSLAERAARRSGIVFQDVPRFLGGTPPPPPPLDGLPPATRDVAVAIQAAIEEILGVEAERPKLQGTGVSAGTYEGTAVLIAGPADFSKIEKGAVLVTASTNAAFNVVLPLLGAIVTERGALLSHAAIVAREYGIPAVVGALDATRVIPHGARVRVDGRTGKVEVL